MENTNTVKLIEKEFLRRKEGNPKYSLRSYANFLELPPGRLSEILNGKRKISLKLANKIADRMCLSPQQKAIFLSPTTNIESQKPYHEISEDIFSIIADWHHTALLALMDTKNFQSNVPWIAKRLRISPLEVRTTIQRLERTGLIQKSTSGWKKTHKDLKTSDGIPSPALRKSHRSSLLQAIESLDSDPMELRDISSITMAIDPSKIELVRPLLKEFRRKICEVLESKNATEIYNLNLQLVPLTRKEKS